MNKKAKVITPPIPKEARIICISDIHGYLDLLEIALEKVKFTDSDILLILGDLYTKGPRGSETLNYIIELSSRDNVYVIRGNSDWLDDNLSDSEREWLENLPHIIETDDYIFVHGGLTSSDLSEQEAERCMKNDAFMEQDVKFDKYIVTGHWPTINYCHEIPCHNPIINEEKRIIAIDGGTIKKGGQLNVFIIEDGKFSFQSTDALPEYRVEKSQSESGGTLNVTWNDRYIEMIEEGAEFSVCRHLPSGKTLSIPNAAIWTDSDGKLCASNISTDYHLAVNEGETVSVEMRFSDRMFTKKNGTSGWVLL